MTRIIDLGNGYGRVERYSSEYASLTFPLTLSGVQRVYIEGYLSENEFQQALLDMRYSEEHAARLVAIANVTVEQWKDKVHGLGTI